MLRAWADRRVNEASPSPPLSFKLSGHTVYSPISRPLSLGTPLSCKYDATPVRYDMATATREALIFQASQGFSVRHQQYRATAPLPSPLTQLAAKITPRPSRASVESVLTSTDSMSKAIRGIPRKSLTVPGTGGPHACYNQWADEKGTLRDCAHNLYGDEINEMSNNFEEHIKSFLSQGQKQRGSSVYAQLQQSPEPGGKADHFGRIRSACATHLQTYAPTRIHAPAHPHKSFLPVKVHDRSSMRVSSGLFAPLPDFGISTQTDRALQAGADQPLHQRLHASPNRSEKNEKGMNGGPRPPQTADGSYDDNTMPYQIGTRNAKEILSVAWWLSYGEASSEKLPDIKQLITPARQMVCSSTHAPRRVAFTPLPPPFAPRTSRASRGLGEV